MYVPILYIVRGVYNIVCIYLSTAPQAAAFTTTLSAAAAIILGCIDFIRRFNRFVQPYRRDGQLQWYINWSFWRDWHTYLNIQIPMLVCTLLFASAMFEECLCAAKWQWRVGTVTVFMAWIRLFFELHQFPMVGLYVEMLQKILQQFINVSLVAVVLVFSFGIPFYMAFHNPTAEVRFHVIMLCVRLSNTLMLANLSKTIFI